ncbi:glycosyltransferase family 4 protein [Brevibacillus sp. 179-C9.3 HS]|uniref:glycosyltransferase family 4 protein n=1 Tax=unclassified Brevibacillus TaxID=2684853 RepID=UPI0039A00BE0
MRIGINLMSVIPGKIGGMEQYVRNLLAYSMNAGDNHQWFLFLSSHNFHTFDAQKNVRKFMVPDRGNVHEMLHYWINSLQLNLWFCPLLVLNPADVKIPSVINIPDIQHEYYPQFFDDHSLRWRLNNYKSSAERCSAVLTLSEFSKQTIIQKFGLPPHKVHAIHLDASREFTLPHDESRNQHVLQKYKLPSDYGFFPANTWHHKNHLNVFKALVTLRDKHDIRIPMVFTGFAQEAHQNVMNYITNNQLWNQIKWLHYVPQEEMPYLYRNAQFLCFPSLFEGFGIPLVEAMKSHIPIVCSNAGSIPEVVGDAALTFDPNISDDIAVKLAHVYLSPDVRTDLVAKGIHQAKHFSWEKCAYETLTVFSSVAH